MAVYKVIHAGSKPSSINNYKTNFIQNSVGAVTVLKSIIRYILFLIPVFFVTLYLLSHNYFASVTQKSLNMTNNQVLSRSLNSFAGELLNNIFNESSPTSNIIVSPFSIQNALTLAALGATGDTYTEFINGLKLGEVANVGLNHVEQRKLIASAFQHTIENLKNTPLLKIANKIYIKENYHIKSSFESLARNQFASEAQLMQFENAASSALAINTWVESKTNNMIRNLISPDSLSLDTRAIMVNAIYFKGLWANQFPIQNTHKAPFYTSDTESTDVDMMVVKAHFQYGVWDDLDATAIELPYKDSDMAMLVVLPNKYNGLATLVDKLKGIDLSDTNTNNKLYRTEVSVQLPKFKIEYDVSLPDILKKMGMETMFNDAATFGELLEENEPMKISDVVHKAYIEVNEEGAEAAAATGVAFMTRSMPMPSNVQYFQADHPFYYAIINVKTGTSLFTGLLNMP